MCWFFNWSQTSTGRSLISTANSRGCLHHTQWWHLFCQARPQVKVSADSRELLTINIHRGLFQYTRLPFGVKTALAIYQQIMLTEVEGAAAYLDDIIVVRQSRADLTEQSNNVLTHIQDFGFQLWPKKCHFYLQAIKYLGFIFDHYGRCPDPANVAAIQCTPPSNISSICSFLGLESHYGSFLPSLHQIKAPLNELLTESIKWTWLVDCQQSFEKIKASFHSDLLLTYFDPTQKMVIAADACSHGVGAVISHIFADKSEKGIMHVARSLMLTEHNCSQVEKKALALTFAVKKFLKMLFGCHFTLLTNHKPLLSIFGSKKGIPVYSASGLQHWTIILLRYDFDIQYARLQNLVRLIPCHASSVRNQSQTTPPST